MNSILDGIKRRVEQLAEVKIYRHSLPHGTELRHDMLRYVKPADLNLIFDVGANMGQTALQFSEWFPNATIHSFEPVPATFALLQNNTRSLANVKPFNLAFSTSIGELPMIVGDDSRTNTLVSNKTLDATKQRTEMVKVTTLDHFAKEQGIRSIDILKIDTEGHDLSVLKGAEGLLRQGRIGFIQVETGFGESRDHVLLNEFVIYLQSAGYALFGLYEQQPYWTGEPWLMFANAVFVRKGWISQP